MAWRVLRLVVVVAVLLLPLLMLRLWVYGCGSTAVGLRLWAYGCGPTAVGLRLWAYGCVAVTGQEPQATFQGHKGQANNPHLDRILTPSPPRGRSHSSPAAPRTDPPGES